MAQVITVTSAPLNTSMTLVAMQAMIADVQSRVVAGQPVLASDMVKIQQLYNAYVPHTHDATDIKYIGYGSFPAFPNTTVTTSSDPTTNTALSLTYSVGDAILASSQSSTALAINSMRVHAHVIDDQILP